MNKKIIKLAIIGNPNVGKSSLFNNLTGLNQRIGNYTGVTVDKKIGFFQYKNNHYQIIDLPGTYSIYPSSEDEEIINALLLDEKNVDYPDKIIVVADSSNIKKSLLLLGQIQDLGFSVLLALNMLDEAKKKGIFINKKKLKKFILSDIVLINARIGTGLNELKNYLNDNKYFYLEKRKKYFFNPISDYKKAINLVKYLYKVDSYRAWYLLASSNKQLKKINNFYLLDKIKKKYKIISKRLQVKETLTRYKEIENICSKIIQKIYSKKIEKYLNFSKKIDECLIIHPVWGYIFFLFILFFIFQCVFFWAEFPKNYIEYFFSIIQEKLEYFHPGPLNNFILHGIIPGITTVITFIPQILILLFFLYLMEESGYLSRVIFLMDRIMRPFGLNGKSIVPLISSMACAIPAIISSRNIENTRDRLITILVTPFITCSARIPVYILIISLIIPDKKWLFIQLRGVMLMIMYLIGIIFALFVAFVLHKNMKNNYNSNLIIEIPTYKIPVLKNIFVNLYIHIKTFIINTGKLILLINILIWGLGSYGPSTITIKNHKNNIFHIQKKKIDNSYLGKIGKKIEPIIRPLGYDWKIGVGLLSSIVAREAFVSTMNSIYEIDKKENGNLIEKMKKEVYLDNKKPIYNLATGISLLFFYSFSMQCTSTLSIVKRETKSWKWPIIQFIFMTLLAYLFSFLTYQMLTIFGNMS
ncbi:ferrous iron transport protein B [Blattabacterium cuenoti]|uniref:ferrous iron transport protein B n=1 Tax=Blattabacterium cuenoti TaxID=1653831 RepID=UPI00163CDC1D|nr:ferrous iron transport protein B [Blattabacterium cuenoti]